MAHFGSDFLHFFASSYDALSNRLPRKFQ